MSLIAPNQKNTKKIDTRANGVNVRRKKVHNLTVLCDLQEKPFVRYGVCFNRRIRASYYVALLCLRSGRINQLAVGALNFCTSAIIHLLAANSITVTVKMATVARLTGVNRSGTCSASGATICIVGRATL